MLSLLSEHRTAEDFDRVFEVLLGRIGVLLPPGRGDSRAQ
jgi:hypothetical protein